MANLSIRVEGAEKLRAQMKSLSDTVAGQVLADAAFLGGHVVRSDASRRAPIKTGNLRASMTVESVSSSRDHAEVAVGPSRHAPYGIFVEFGTRRMSAQPYLRPALDANRGRVRSEIGQALKRALEAAL